MKSDENRRGRLVPRAVKRKQRNQHLAALIRERELSSREESAELREKKIADWYSLERIKEESNLHLRQANENLIIASIESHMIADKLEIARAEMAHLANFDFLTNLPNRMQLYDRIGLAISSARRNESKLIILFMDLDRFKDVNDTFGHAIGDKLLQAVALRLTSSVRESDTVSRPGGDEFVLLLPDAGERELLIPIIEKIHNTVTAPYVIASHDLDIGATIGISIFPEDGEDVETLIRNADAAMYHAKEGGRNTYQFFTHEMRGRNISNEGMETILLRALTLNQFVLFYQAQVNIESGKITGVEALLRWKHPEHGLLLADSFIRDAEDCGAIVEIGRWVLLEACSQAQAWLLEDIVVNLVAVNISAQQFASSRFLDDVQFALRKSGLSPDKLELEMTETVLMTNIAATATTLRSLRFMGVKIAINDFGSGYSSLSCLQKFSVDTIKIDRSFVQDISDSKAEILIKAIIGIGKGFQQQIVAEGVETAEQFSVLRDNHCSTAQGFYLNRPMAAAAFTEFLKTIEQESPMK